MKVSVSFLIASLALSSSSALAAPLAGVGECDPASVPGTSNSTDASMESTGKCPQSRISRHVAKAAFYVSSLPGNVGVQDKPLISSLLPLLTSLLGGSSSSSSSSLFSTSPSTNSESLDRLGRRDYFAAAAAVPSDRSPRIAPGSTASATDPSGGRAVISGLPVPAAETGSASASAGLDAVNSPAAPSITPAAASSAPSVASSLHPELQASAPSQNGVQNTPAQLPAVPSSAEAPR
jgi:hypothetical protein